ncbi:MAG: hypothetical protein IKP69_06540 [Oscillospiraceae bacterium]|nr:hypothetical protein [Oscillospiraceae bacterium]
MTKIMMECIPTVIPWLIFWVVSRVMISHHFKVSREKREEFFDKMESELHEMEAGIDKLHFSVQELRGELEELKNEINTFCSEWNKI